MQNLIKLSCLITGGIVSIWLTGCQGSARSEQVAKAPASNSAEGAIARLAEVRSLDDQANPYAGKYQDWDRWIATHAVAVTAPGVSPTASFDFNAEEDPAVNGFTVELDENGFQLPLIESVRLMEDSLSSPKALERLQSLRKVTAAGKIDPVLYAKGIDAFEEVRAAYYPLIPAWLAENPPLAAVMLPNGEIATKGMPGSGISSQPQHMYDKAQLGTKESRSCCGGGDNPGWFRYSADGVLQGSTPRDFWWYLYYDPDVTEIPAGRMRIRNDGYAIFTDPADGKLLSVWDWDGTPLPAVEPDKRSVHPFSHLRPHRLVVFYKAQQRILTGKAAAGIEMHSSAIQSDGGAK